jgi:hypothetical protein
MQKTSIFLIAIAFYGTACNKPTASLAPEVKSGYTVINNGNAAVTTIDATDSTKLAIDQAIPSVSNQTYYSNTPIIFFMNDKVLLSSIYDNIIVMQDDIKVKGTIYVNESYNGNAIITFTPTDAFSSNGNTISIVMKKDIQSKGGTKLLGDYVISYKTTSPSLISFDDNKDFERGYSGVSFSGDGSLLIGKFGTEKPFQGTRYAAISTGTQIVSTGTAIGNTSSMMYLGPINSNISSFSFEYDFISSEFNEYVGKRTDDAAIVTVYGPLGTYTEQVTSVNTVGIAGNTRDTIPKLPDGGDNYVGHTGWLRKTISFKNVGNPAFIVFTVTNVADKQLTSILMVDSLAY